MKVTFLGNPVTLEGQQQQAGNQAPHFTAVANDLSPVSSEQFEGKRIYVSVPSLDTEVCDMEVRRFNEEATKLGDTKVYVISMDLPFAQARWCGASGVENVVTISDYKDREFGQKFGTYIKEFGLVTRAVIVVDANNQVVYSEYCEEITHEPNYAAALEAVKNC